MQQRRLRLGDILDDYCPRERRITNHVVVAMIDDDVKQTRCTTCDADHEYKQARVPSPRRKKDALLGTPDGEQPVDDTPLTDESPAEIAEALPAEEPQVESDAAAMEDAEDDADPSRENDEGPVHRRLIRATLPRPEGQNPERKEPEFTIRQGGRGREFDGNRAGGGGGGQRHGRGRRAARGGGQQGQPGGPPRFGGPRQNGAQGQRQNSNRPGPPGGQRGGGRPPGQRGPGRKRGR
jgi:hypothetical protein